MKYKIPALALVTTLCMHISVMAEPPKDVSPADMKQLRKRLCELNGDSARNIVIATMAAKKFDAMPEILKQTEAGSPLREVMIMVFRRPFLLNAVLVQVSAFGAEMLPNPQNIQARKDIAELAYTYVTDSCLVSSIN